MSIFAFKLLNMDTLFTSHSLFIIAIAVLPAFLMLLMSYFLIDRYLRSNDKAREWELQSAEKTREFDLRMKTNAETMPVRFQALERLTLLMERVSPMRLLSRLSPEGLTAPEYHLIIIRSIRQEMEHNITQQIYIGDESWNMIRSVIEEQISIVNMLAKALPPEATGRDLQRAIINYMQEPSVAVPSDKGIAQLKMEARSYMG